MPGFLALAAELRIQIYETIIYNAFETSTLVTLDLECGLILSCRQVYLEFESEWCKAMNTIIAVLTKITILRSTPISSFACIINLSVYFYVHWLHQDSTRWPLRHRDKILLRIIELSIDIVPQLTQCVRRLTLYADQPANPKTPDTDTDTLSGIFRSDSYKPLRYVQNYLRPGLDFLSILNPWIPALECEYRCQHGTSSHTPANGSSRGAHAREIVLALTITRQVEDKPSLATLGEYTGALLATRSVQEAFSCLRQGGSVERDGCY